MILSHNTPEPNAPAIQIVRGARWIARAIKRHHMEPALSWLIWLACVAVFAGWTLAHYQAPAAPAWIGMTIHTTVFAIWTLVAREWLILRWLRRMGERPARHKEER
jgi:hypothetical protein